MILRVILRPSPFQPKRPFDDILEWQDEWNKLDYVDAVVHAGHVRQRIMGLYESTRPKYLTPRSSEPPDVMGNLEPRTHSVVDLIYCILLNPTLRGKATELQGDAAISFMDELQKVNLRYSNVVLAAF